MGRRSRSRRAAVQRSIDIIVLFKLTFKKSIWLKCENMKIESKSRGQDLKFGSPWLKVNGKALKSFLFEGFLFEIF